MIKIDSSREFKLKSNSFLVLKKINLKEIGFNKISNSNLYTYQSDEYKVLNYSIKPRLIFLINNEDNFVYVKLHSINIKNSPIIFRSIKLVLEVKIFPENEFSNRLIRYWNNIMNNSSKYSLKLLYVYIRSPFFRCSNKSLKSHIKFVFRCFIGYEVKF